MNTNTPQANPTTRALECMSDSENSDAIGSIRYKPAEIFPFPHFCRRYCKTYDCHYEGCPKVQGKIHRLETYKMWEKEAPIRE